MFDLRSNFLIKVASQAYDPEGLTFLCINKALLESLFENFPKSKVIIQKRALERRKVFIEKL